MTRPFDKHLDGDELDGLVSAYAASVADLEPLSEQALADAQRHVESCEDCNRKVQMHRSVQSEISRLGETSDLPPGPNCVAKVEWLNVAAGLLPEMETRELMKHAAQCRQCGPLLRHAIDTLSDEATEKEESALKTLRSSRPEAQKAIAERLRFSKVNRSLDREQGSLWRERIWPRGLETLAPSLFDFLLFRRAVAGTVVAFAVVAFCWLYLENRHLQAELIRLRGDSTATATSLLAQELGQKQRTTQLMVEREAQKPRSNTEETSLGNSPIVQFALNPGLARDVDGEARLLLPPLIRFVEITLRSPERPIGVLREELLRSDGRVLWSQEGAASSLEREKNTIVMLLPEHVLRSDDYRIKLMRKSDSGGMEVISTYAFRVTR